MATLDHDFPQILALTEAGYERLGWLRSLKTSSTVTQGICAKDASCPWVPTALEFARCR